MAVRWHCDCCGTPGHIHPPTEPLFDEREVEVEVPEARPDPDNEGKVLVTKVKKRITQKHPRTVKLRQQNMHTGKIETLDVQAHKDLEPRSFIVTLKVGHEEITRHFCGKCLDEFKAKLKKVWDALEGIG